MKLKQNAAGETIQVIENTQTNEVPFGSDEIKRQIAQHSQVIEELQLQLQAVEKFESNELAEEEVVISDKIDKPIINKTALADVSFIKEKPVDEPVIIEDITVEKELVE